MDNERELLRGEVARRRTFAIISHPDAGKTTLTEKLLLYGGAVHIAGAVKAKRATRHATSDWMELEKERGISITTSVMQFEHRGCHFNLLDTPGHNDFSEDTYRTLAAADSAVMLIDSVKGVEPQTIKLFEVCRLRKIPIVTFMNKLDRYGRAPLDLCDEIERVLGIPTAPLTWPVGAGAELQGVYDRESRALLRFERVEAGAQTVPMQIASIDDPLLRGQIGAEGHRQLVDDLALLDEAGDRFDRDRFLAGELTPVFFGSAMNNFGVEPFLDRFVDLAPAPTVRATSAGPLAADEPRFTAFVFKIQANMDPHHRDRVAFLRICSGRFRRGMEVVHARTGKKLTLSRSLHFLAQERVLVEEAFSGDILGLWDPGVLRIGDALTEGPPLEFDGIPRFSPERFVRARLGDPMKRKQLKKGMEQIADEGGVQLLFDPRGHELDPIVGAVGWLQLEVLQYRLKHEYGVDVAYENLPYSQARWVEGGEFDPDRALHRSSIACFRDVEDRPLVLFDTEWVRRRTEEQFPDLRFVAAAQPGRSGRRS